MVAKKNGGPEYDVGYGKPPKEHQFKPGQSGNPRGRKKKYFPPEDGLFRAFSEPVPVQRLGRKMMMPLPEALGLRLREKGLTGNVKDALALLQAMVHFKYFDYQHFRAWDEEYRREAEAEDERQWTIRLKALLEKGQTSCDEEVETDWKAVARSLSDDELSRDFEDANAQLKALRGELQLRRRSGDGDAR